MKFELIDIYLAKKYAIEIKKFSGYVIMTTNKEISFQFIDNGTRFGLWFKKEDVNLKKLRKYYNIVLKIVSYNGKIGYYFERIYAKRGRYSNKIIEDARKEIDEIFGKDEL